MPAVTWDKIRAKSKKIRRVLVQDTEHASNSMLLDKVISHGWIQKLQDRHNLKQRRIHGEAASARAVDVEKGRAELQNITSEYRYRDILNMDEPVYFYCTASLTSVSRSSVAGRVNIKKRLTVVITTNADGSFKVPLLFVCTAKNPRCFGTHMVAELRINYTNAAKGWMATQLFRTWLGCFNDTMRGQNRHVILLLLSNASPHRVMDHYAHVKLYFLPPNAPTHLQPQDAGIIKSFKSQLSKIRDNHLVDKFDAML